MTAPRAETRGSASSSSVLWGSSVHCLCDWAGEPLGACFLSPKLSSHLGGEVWGQREQGLVGTWLFVSFNSMLRDFCFCFLSLCYSVIYKEKTYMDIRSAVNE